MDLNPSHHVLPDPDEEQWVTLPGPQPGTALRVYVLPGPGGYVRLQQLELAQGMGWTVQKSFVIPGELLRELIPQLRKADCLIPRQGAMRLAGDAPLRLVPAEPADGPDSPEPELRRA